MDTLRVILFGGLLFHKVVWEVMKPQVSIGERHASQDLLKRLVKYTKGAILVCLIFQTLFLTLLPISDNPILLQTVGMFIYAIGLTVAVIGRLQLGKNWANLEDYQVLQGQVLVKHGIYHYIRHPIYIGDLLLLFGLELALNSWLVLGVFFVLWLVIKQALAEEALLAQTFEDYADYSKHTKRFIPFLV